MSLSLDFARRVDGTIVDASLLNPMAWRQLQVSYTLGELSMPCCDSPAIPKTSPNGLQFFAHAAGTCGGAPETIWHEGGKQAVRDAARSLGHHAVVEQPGTTEGKRWCADVWIETPRGPAVVEVQHSYQHLRAYLERQQRYEAAGIRCLWLLMLSRYTTLGKATMQKRFVEEFDKQWPDDECQCLRELPVAAMELEPVPYVRGPRLQAPLEHVLAAFLDARLTWRAGAWVLPQ